MPTLFELDSEYIDLMRRLDEGECNDEAAALFTTNEENWASKLDGYWKMMKQYEMDHAAITAMIDQMEAKAKSLENRQAFMKKRLEETLRLRGITEHKTPLFKLAIRKASQRAVVIDDKTQIPDEFIRREMVETIDKAMLQTVLKAGHDVPGVHLAEPTEWFEVK